MLVGVVYNGRKEADLQSLNHLSCDRPQRSMDIFTNSELADMYLMYVLAEGNARAAARLYREKYPQRDVPDHRMFSNLHHNLSEYGSLRSNRQSEGRPRVTRTPNMEQNALDTVSNALDTV